MTTVVDLKVRRWKKYEEILLEKLGVFGRQICTESALNHALETFWGSKGLSSPEFDDDVSFARFFDWFLFDYRRASRSRRVIERFRSAVWDDLSGEERRLLQDWMEARLSVFEVTAVRPGDGVTLTDIFSGEKFDVFERGISHSLHKFDLLFTRPLKVFDTYGLSVAGLVIPRSWKRTVESLAEYEFARYRRRHPEADWHAFLRAGSHRINRTLVDLLLDRPEPRLQTASGEDVVLCRAWFEVDDLETVAEALDSVEVFRRRGESRNSDGLLRGGSWVWFGGEGPLAGNLVLGEIRLTEGRLRLQCLSRQRLDAGKAILAERLDENIRHRLDEYRSPRAGNYLPIPSLAGARTEELPAEMAGMLNDFLEAYYKRWVDDPVPALGGDSPRQACRTGDGREQVIELLKYLENLEEKKKKSGQPHFEVNLIRRELGLPEEE